MAGAYAQKRTRGLARLLFGTVPDDQIQRAYRLRVGLFFVLLVIIGEWIAPTFSFKSRAVAMPARRWVREHHS